MSRNLFQQVWFADEKRNRSIKKLLVFTDRGSLEVEPDFVLFSGRKLKLKISNIKNVSLARQRIGWIPYLIMNVLLIVWFGFLTITRPDVYSFSFLLPLLLGANAFSLIVAYSTKWVRVEYSDDVKRITQAYFADGSLWGWGGLFGETKKMYQMLKSLMKREKNATS